ncbi:MAG: hypothetical protein M1484_03255 [Patescibacteria group bacterium]|nr:hypothetical protein [Patescibacteria group bacterium]MCL5432079.1 hypothetical protein [Patescibacteria group bacterium]
MIEINLLPPKNLLSKKEAALRRRLVTGAISVSIIFLVTLASLLVIESYWDRRLTDISVQKQQLAAQFSADAAKAAQLVKLKNKLMGIRMVQTTRPDITAILKKLTDFRSIGGVTYALEEVSVNGNVSIKVNCQDQSAFNAYVDQITSPTTAKFFNNVTLTAMTLNADGTFNFDLTGQFDKSKL